MAIFSKAAAQPYRLSINSVPVSRACPSLRQKAGASSARSGFSDIHLGTRGCNAEMLIDFLDNVDSDTMYLVGDIIDGWRLKKRFYWPTGA